MTARSFEPFRKPHTDLPQPGTRRRSPTGASGLRGGLYYNRIRRPLRSDSDAGLRDATRPLDCREVLSRGRSYPYSQVNFTVNYRATIWLIACKMDRISTGNEAMVQLRHKVLRRFYEPLLLLSALGQMRGERTKSEITDTLSPNIQQLRRSFQDGIAYICAYEKEPSRVTAVALERTPQGITVWLAANENIREHVVQFLECVLSDIRRIAEPSDKDSRLKEGERVKDDLTSRVIAFNTHRINVYYGQVVRILEALKIMSEEHKHGSKLSMTLNPAVRLQTWIFANRSA